MERESMEFDVVIVGAGPAGLSTAIKLMQASAETESPLSVCVIEKGSEVGAHIISGAVFEPEALAELFPNWKDLDTPVKTPVKRDEIYVLPSESKARKVPHFFVPETMNNEGNYIISLGNLCRWLGEQAEALGVEIFPGFAAAEVLYDEHGAVKGVITGDMGIAADGSEKDSYMPGMELHAKITVFAEGARGHLGKQLIAKYSLDANSDTQHFGLGIKELWQVDPSVHDQGLVIHSAGWPLAEHDAAGGAFMYHLEDNQVVVGLITDLSYSNPYVSPYDEFQRMKLHPLYAKYLKGGKRVSYGARAINKGGPQCLPKMHFPGGLLIGCDAGTMNGAKIKGSHAAMKSGLLAAKTILKQLKDGLEYGQDLSGFAQEFDQSSLKSELHFQRNFNPAQHRWGNIIGSAYSFVDMNICRGKLPWTLKDPIADYQTLKPAQGFEPIHYPKPDGQLTFDKLSSVFLSNTNHEEDQPVHLKLADEAIPVSTNLPMYDEPAQRYCPAGVYEIVASDNGNKRLQINAQNCLHCKTCDIKDPSQNITWVTPEGSGGPNYPNM
ncbi:electron transfer flavoprotein-ubiquinone oxidoreductase [Reinekea marinisedimentorum]|uniref:Electron transfer flavoprotein-ubiquinone oxidoreductase n=1 Tax=Reinekea marinisedimentorum TaxID=230495 RepID=A0A4R3I9J4_9GAMM|nr:electron transfer flavoprotein-ubiquinone oxidoreductase [Reinekea marinisedimentorum]TCS42548.1 electron-transferring-flavoprotein dehydrogenase [Reinekea marinisedimentorum]